MYHINKWQNIKNPTKIMSVCQKSGDWKKVWITANNKSVWNPARILRAADTMAIYNSTKLNYQDISKLYEWKFVKTDSL